MASTTVVDVRRWLVELFREQGDLAGVHIHYAYPGAELVGKQAIYCGPAEAQTVEPAAHRAARYRRRESYVLPVIVAVAGDGMTQEAADERCVEIYGAIDYLLADTDNVQAVGAVSADQQVLSLRIVGWRQVQGPFEDGHGSAFEIRVDVEAQSL